ncbi:MAG: PDZ domain-containing protein, partial [Gemmatimonadota bacterium]
MNGFIRLRGRSTLLLGLALLCVPASLQGQTAAERAREEVVRQRMEEARLRYREATSQYQEQAQEAKARAQEQLRKAQEVVIRVRSRVRLGVFLDGTQGDETDRQGARIQSIIEGSPAEEAGLQEGDIITHLNGQSLLGPLSEEGEKKLGQEESLPVLRLMALAQELDAGDEVEVRYLRAGQSQTVSFEAAEIDDPSFTVLRGDRRDAEGFFRFDFPELERLERLERLED